MAQKSVLQYSHLPVCLILAEDLRRTSEPEVQRNFSPAPWTDSCIWKQWWWRATGVWKLEISKFQFTFCRHVKYFCPASRNAVGAHADSSLSYPTWLHTFCCGKTHKNPDQSWGPEVIKQKKPEWLGHVVCILDHVNIRSLPVNRSTIILDLIAVLY